MCDYSSFTLYLSPNKFTARPFEKIIEERSQIFLPNKLISVRFKRKLINTVNIFSQKSRFLFIYKGYFVLQVKGSLFFFFIIKESLVG